MHVHDVVSDCNATATAKPDEHITRAVAIACTDDFIGLYLVDVHLLLSHSDLNLQSNQLQQLPPGVFSSLTSLRSLTCVVECIENGVCMSVFDLRGYDRQLKAKLHFRGRVNKNACEQSCTTLCQLYLASAPRTLMVTMGLLACVYAC